MTRTIKQIKKCSIFLAIAMSLLLLLTSGTLEGSTTVGYDIQGQVSGAGVVIEATHENGKRGENILLQFHVSENTPTGFTSLALEVQFDTNVLEFIGPSSRIFRENLPAGQRAFYDFLRSQGQTDAQIQNTFAAYRGGNHGANRMTAPTIIQAPRPDEDPSVVRYIWTVQGDNVYIGTGLYMELEFRIRNNAPAGVSNINLRVPSIGGVVLNAVPVSFSMRNGSVTVIGDTSGPGNNVPGTGGSGNNIPGTGNNVPGTGDTTGGIGDGTGNNIPGTGEPGDEIGNNEPGTGGTTGGTRRPAITAPTTPIEDAVLGVFTGSHEAYLVGFPDGTIRPNSTITRAEVATIFFRLLADSYRTQVWSQQNAFSDVTINNWFNNAVSTLTNAGIIEGFPDGTFRGNQAITRAEFVTIVSRFIADSSHTGANLFNDINGHWAQDAINAVGYYDWIRGFEGGTFRPNQSITRAETAAIVNRMLKRQPEAATDLLPGMVIWSDNMNTNAWFYLYIQEATNSHDFEMKADGVHERWTELRGSRNWTVLERPNSNPQDILR